MNSFKSLIRSIPYLVLIVSFLSIYGYAVKRLESGKSNWVFTKPIKALADFPETVLTVIRSDEVKNIPPTFLERDTAFKEINHLTFDVYGLNSFFNVGSGNWDVRLFNLKTDSVIHSWVIKEENFVDDLWVKFKNSEPINGLVLKDKKLLIFSGNTNNFYLLDKNSNILWQNSGMLFHHSLNLDADTNLWICTRVVGKFLSQDTKEKVKGYNNKNKLHFYKNDCITKINTKNGEILFTKSVKDILAENGYNGIVFGSNNSVFSNSDDDPLHLNDIQPVLHDSEFWKKGDLFVSIRNKSLFFLYRPSTNKILRLVQGPFINQHDIDIISDHEVSIFNNNFPSMGIHQQESDMGIKDSDLGTDTLNYSEMLIYNFKDSTYSSPYKKVFSSEKFLTQTQGETEFLDSTHIYAENQNNGKIYIFNKEKCIYRKQLPASKEGYIETPHWLRIYTNLNFE